MWDFTTNAQLWDFPNYSNDVMAINGLSSVDYVVEPSFNYIVVTYANVVGCHLTNNGTRIIWNQFKKSTELPINSFQELQNGNVAFALSDGAIRINNMATQLKGLNYSLTSDSSSRVFKQMILITSHENALAAGDATGVVCFWNGILTPNLFMSCPQILAATAAVTAMANVAGGNLAVGGSDGVICIINVHSELFDIDPKYITKRTLAGHSVGDVVSIKHMSGVEMVSAAVNGEVFVWNAVTGDLLRSFSLHVTINSLDVVPNTNQITFMVGTSTDLIQLDSSTGAVLNKIAGVVAGPLAVLYAPGMYKKKNEKKTFIKDNFKIL
jgi:WD40 repeat protein